MPSRDGVRAHVEGDGAADLRLQLVGIIQALMTFGGGDGVPDLLRGAGDGELELEAVRDVRCRHCGSSEGSGVSTTGGRRTHRWSWLGVGGDDEAVGAPAVVVVAGDEIEDGRGELVGERGAIGGRLEADLRVDGEGRQALAGVVGLAGQARRPRGRGGRRARSGSRADRLIGDLLRAGAVAGDRGRRHDVARGGGPEHALADAAAHAHLGQLDEAVRLERRRW